MQKYTPQTALMHKRPKPFLLCLCGKLRKLFPSSTGSYLVDPHSLYRRPARETITVGAEERFRIIQPSGNYKKSMPIIRAMRNLLQKIWCCGTVSYQDSTKTSGCATAAWCECLETKKTSSRLGWIGWVALTTTWKLGKEREATQGKYKNAMTRYQPAAKELKSSMIDQW
jgi:hypothetical protein